METTCSCPSGRGGGEGEGSDQQPLVQHSSKACIVSSLVVTAMCALMPDDKYRTGHVFFLFCLL